MYGNLGKVKEVRGNVHRYLGMKFVFGEGKVKIDMANYIKRMLEEFPVKFHKHKFIGTPAGQDMFSGDDSKKLNEQERELFHQTVAQGLILCKRARPDTLPIISVSCTRVQQPGKRTRKN